MLPTTCAIRPARCRWFSRFVLVVTLATVLSSTASAEGTASDRYPAQDTLVQLDDDQPAAADVLRQIQWQPGAFHVTVHPPNPPHDADATVRFASPLTSDRAQADQPDTVPLLWYKARDPAGRLLDEPAPAVLVVHTIHPQMLVGKAIARHFAREGLHAFLLQLPGFGDRTRPGRPGPVVLFENAPQAVADARRARDAIAALPGVAEGPIALQATSLGGFVATVAASLDNAFNPVLLALTGGDGFDVLQNGQMDAAQFRGLLQTHGHHGQTLRDQLDTIEPLHVAHRLNATQAWLFTGQHDQVIPPANAEALATAIGLHDAHHIRFDADHYTAMFHLPTILRQMTEIVRETHASLSTNAESDRAQE